MNDAEQVIVSVGGLAVVTALIYFLFVFAIFLLPVVGIGALMIGGVYAYYHSDGYLEKKARQHTHALYQEALGRYQAEAPVDLAMGIVEELPDTPILAAIAEVAHTVIREEGIAAVLEPPLVCHSIEGARYRDKLSSLTEFTSPKPAKWLLVDTFTRFIEHLPDIDPEGPFTIPLIDLLEHSGEAIEALIMPLYAERGLFSSLKRKLERNLAEVSGGAHKEAVLPSDYAGENIAYAYLKDTPFLHLLDLHVPFGLPAKTRFEHHWIVAPPGTGKSTTLQCLLNHDFDRVAAGEASVIVMESNRDLVKAIEGLARFGPDGDLNERLIVIDVEDVEYPVALNLFDIGLDQFDHASPRDREALFNSAVSMLDYVFRALLGAEMTSRQSTLFNFTIQLLIHIPGATLDTLIDLMQPSGLAEYRQYLSKVDEDTRRFFDIKFDSPEFDQTKRQVVDRLFAIKRIRTLSRMFSAPRTRLDLYAEMGKGRVILINCAKSLLQEEGVEIVSRFFLATILLAAEKRQLLPQSERMPTYVYIDECQDVIRRDEKLPIILDQARKFRVAMILAHQRLEQMSPPVLSALYGSTAIKFASKLNDNAFARQMNTTAEFIRNQPDYSYAVFIRGRTDHAISLRIPHIDMSATPRMSPEEQQPIREQMRARYALRRVHTQSAGEEPAPPEYSDEDEISPQPWG